MNRFEKRILVLAALHVEALAGQAVIVLCRKLSNQIIAPIMRLGEVIERHAQYGHTDGGALGVVASGWKTPNDAGIA